MKTKPILEAATLASVLLLLAVTWPINRAILASNDAPALTGLKVEYTHIHPDHRPPGRIILEIQVGETVDQWQARLREAAEGLEKFR